MSTKTFNPNAKPFFHFTSKPYSKLNPNAEPFFCNKNPSLYYRPFNPTTSNHIALFELPRVTRVVRTKKLYDHHACKPKFQGEKHKNWRKENSGERNRRTSKVEDVIPFPTFSSCTTVMIKNIPNQFRREDLVYVLSFHCRKENEKSNYKSEFDFVYLPMDFKQYWENKRVVNLGYAFVNFTSHVAAVRFHHFYHNRPWLVDRNRKICEVTCAKIQGKQALTRQFENSLFWCHTDLYLPAVLEPACDGEAPSKYVNIGTRVCAPSKLQRNKVKKIKK